MKILDFYIARILISTSALCLLVLTGLSGIIKWVDQIRLVGRGTYSLLDAGIYVLFLIPRDIEMFFPMAVLLGALIGIGMLASNSELVVMQSAGLSRFQITLSALKTAMPLMIVVMVIGEWGAPIAEHHAKELKAVKLSGGNLFKFKRGIWAKDNNLFVNIGRIEDVNNLRNITLYRFDNDLNLLGTIEAKRGVYTQNHWQLLGVRQTTITKTQVTSKNLTVYQWDSTLTPDKLGVVSIEPEALSITGLIGYLDYLRVNKQESDRYELALWRKLMQPITVAVMILVALSFIFGPLRTVTMGGRVLLGVVAGFSFYICNEIFGPLTLVYHMPPIIGAVMPPLIFSGGAIYYIRQ